MAPCPQKPAAPAFRAAWEGQSCPPSVANPPGQCCFLSAGPGISSYSSNPPAAGTSLVPCLNQALGDVPKEKQAGTPLYLGATAGMRLLQ